MPEMKTLLSWRASEYPYYAKNTRWYAILFIATIVFMIIAYMMNNFLFGVFMIIAGFTVAMFGAKNPSVVDFHLTVQGIAVGGRLYPYRNIKSFWVHYDPPAKKEISLLLQKTINPRVTLSLGEVDPNAVRDILIQFVKEEPQNETFSDAISRYLGF